MEGNATEELIKYYNQYKKYTAALSMRQNN
jgi:hypothetical protein